MDGKLIKQFAITVKGDSHTLSAVSRSGIASLFEVPIFYYAKFPCV